MTRTDRFGQSSALAPWPTLLKAMTANISRLKNLLMINLPSLIETTLELNQYYENKFGQSTVNVICRQTTRPLCFFHLFWSLSFQTLACCSRNQRRYQPKVRVSIVAVLQNRAMLAIEFACSSAECAAQQSSTTTTSKSRSCASRTVACTTACVETPRQTMR